MDTATEIRADGPGRDERLRPDRDQRAQRPTLAYAWPAIALYALVRIPTLILVNIWAHAIDRGFAEMIARADGEFLVKIAQHGYDHGGPVPRSNMAFFPLYPGLVGVVARMLPGDPYRGVAIGLAWVAALAAAWGLFAVGNHLGGRRVGILLAVLWGVVPHAVVESMAYTEPLFTALSAWSLYFLLRRSWLLAGALCLFAGLTRAIGVALVGVVCLAALIAILRRRDGWRPYAALLLAPAGWLGYLAWVGQRTGHPDGWFRIQNQQWKSSFDGGGYTYRTAFDLLATGRPVHYYVITLELVLALGLFAVCLLDRQPWPLLLFSALQLAATLGGDGYYHAKARFLLPAFGLLLPVAAGLARTTTAKATAVVTTMLVISTYLGGYLLLVWAASP
jgi:hypothetical protein